MTNTALNFSSHCKQQWFKKKKCRSILGTKGIHFVIAVHELCINELFDIHIFHCYSIDIDYITILKGYK